MVFFEGAMTMSDLMGMPLTELGEWFKVAEKISREQKAEMNKLKSK